MEELKPRQLSKKRQEKCIEEFRTNRFTLQELCNRNNLCIATVHKITRGVKRDLEGTVKLLADLHSEEAMARINRGNDEESILSTEEEKERKLKLTSEVVDDAVKLIVKEREYIRQLTYKNLKDIESKLNTTMIELSVRENTDIQNTIDKASITLGINPRFPNSPVDGDKKAISTVMQVPVMHEVDWEKTAKKMQHNLVNG